MSAKPHPSRIEAFLETTHPRSFASARRASARLEAAIPLSRMKAAGREAPQLRSCRASCRSANAVIGMGIMMLSRNDAEHAVPAEWQATFHQIAGAFAVKDYGLRDHPISGVCPVGRSTAEFIAESIEAYGDSLATLHPATWEHAIYRWMDG